jgi:hypothetical protein
MDVRAELFLPTVVRLVPEPRFLASQGEPGSFERVETPPSREATSGSGGARGASTSVKSLPMWKQSFISGVSSGVSWISNVVPVGA